MPYICCLDDIRLSSSRETNNTDKDRVNKQKHSPNTQRKTKNGKGYYENK